MDRVNDKFDIYQDGVKIVSGLLPYNNVVGSRGPEVHFEQPFKGKSWTKISIKISSDNSCSG
jgi:hypothetical protein